MKVKNRNTKREKRVIKKRLKIAVFIVLFIGIISAVFQYFKFVSATVYEESVSHLTEVFHQSDNMLRELINKNLTYLHMWGENLQNTSSEDEICDYIESTGRCRFFRILFPINRWELQDGNRGNRVSWITGRY